MKVVDPQGRTWRVSRRWMPWRRRSSIGDWWQVPSGSGLGDDPISAIIGVFLLILLIPVVVLSVVVALEMLVLLLVLVLVGVGAGVAGPLRAAVEGGVLRQIRPRGPGALPRDQADRPAHAGWEDAALLDRVEFDVARAQAAVIPAVGTILSIALLVAPAAGLRPWVSRPEAPASLRKHGVWATNFSGSCLASRISPATMLVSDTSAVGIR